MALGTNVAPACPSQARSTSRPRPVPRGPTIATSGVVSSSALSVSPALTASIQARTVSADSESRLRERSLKKAISDQERLRIASARSTTGSFADKIRCCRRPLWKVEAKARTEKLAWHDATALEHQLGFGS